jgi:putative PIN family toxin of toxin-antitoxin system
LRAVVDSNVLVSAFLKPAGKPAKILRLILQGDLEIVVNEQILTEYAEVLSRPKFDLPAGKVRSILGFIRAKAIQAPALMEAFQLPDMSDEPFLEAAVATKADALVTGNKRHFPKKVCKGLPVVSPAEFLRNLGE